MTRANRKEPLRRARNAWGHRIRLAQPLVDFDHDKPNRCAWKRCQRPAAYVQTWRVGNGVNAKHCSRLLCATHAAKAQTQNPTPNGAHDHAQVDQPTA